MPASPVFWVVSGADRAELLKSLRLEKATAGNIDDVIDAEIKAVRVGLYSHLGEARVAELLAIPYEENATTLNKILRLKAHEAERLWLKLGLLRSLPTMFMDSSADQRQTWNDDGFTRNAGDGDLERMKTHLKSKVAMLLDQLASTSEATSPKLSATNIEPEKTFKPGQTVFGTPDSDYIPGLGLVRGEGRKGYI
jgi:hypothetical protein